MKARTMLLIAAGSIALVGALPVGATTFTDTGTRDRPAELDLIPEIADVPAEVLALLDEDNGGGDTGGGGPGGGGGGGGGGTPPPAPDTDPTLPPSARVDGPDRFGTAAALSARVFSPGVPVVYLATGSGFADALAGAAVATGNGPVLLVRQDAIPASTVGELTRLRPGRIVLLGGPAVISEGVEAAAAAYTSGSVTRWSGADRFATAARVSAEAFTPGVDVAYVATGLVFADALSVGPVAAGESPVLLVRPTSIPDATAGELTRLRPGRIVVLGGRAAVSDEVVAALAAFTDGAVTRIEGRDRFATSVAISQARFAPGVPVAFLATGLDFADALAAAPATEGLGPILLTRPDCVPTVVIAELQRLDPDEVFVVGGRAAVSDAVMSLTPCG